MQKIEEKLFEMKVQSLGLKKVGATHWFLPGCDLTFSYNKYWCYIDVNGIVPMDLSIELYNCFKKVETETIINTTNGELLDPLSNAIKVIKHPSINFPSLF